jgi:hypothetical protein
MSGAFGDVEVMTLFLLARHCATCVENRVLAILHSLEVALTKIITFVENPCKTITFVCHIITGSRAITK